MLRKRKGISKRDKITPMVARHKIVNWRESINTKVKRLFKGPSNWVNSKENLDLTFKKTDRYTFVHPTSMLWKALFSAPGILQYFFFNYIRVLTVAQDAELQWSCGNWCFQLGTIALARIGANLRVLVFCLIKLFYNKIIEYRCTGTFSPINETLGHHIPRREICSSTFLTRERESEENLDTTCTIHRSCGTKIN